MTARHWLVYSPNEGGRSKAIGKSKASLRAPLVNPSAGVFHHCSGTSPFLWVPTHASCCNAALTFPVVS
jgi:hypothetical protein